MNRAVCTSPTSRRWPALCPVVALVAGLAPAVGHAQADAGSSTSAAIPIGTFLGVGFPADGNAVSDKDVKKTAEGAEKELIATLVAAPVMFESPDDFGKRTSQTDFRVRIQGTSDDQLSERVFDNATLWKYDFVLSVRYAKAESGEWLLTGTLFRKDGHLVGEVTQRAVPGLVSKIAALIANAEVTETHPCAEQQSSVTCENPAQGTAGDGLDIHCSADPPGAIKLDLRVKKPGEQDFATSPFAPSNDGTARSHVIPNESGEMSFVVLGFEGQADPDTAQPLCTLNYQPIHIAPAPVAAPVENPDKEGSAAPAIAAPVLVPPNQRPGFSPNSIWPDSWNKNTCPEGHQACRATRLEPFIAGDYCLDGAEEQMARVDVLRIYSEIKNTIGIFDKDGRMTGARRAALVITGYASRSENEHTSKDFEKYVCQPPPPESGLLPVDNVYMKDPDLDQRLAFYRGESLYMSLLLLSIQDAPSAFKSWFPHIMNTTFITSKGGGSDAEREPDPMVGHAEVTAKVVGLQSAGNARSSVGLILFEDDVDQTPADVTSRKSAGKSSAGHGDDSGINVLNVKVAVDQPPSLATSMLELEAMRPKPPAVHWMEWIGGAAGVSGLALVLTGSLIAGNATVANNNSLYETGANNTQALQRSYDGYAVLGTGLIMTLVGGAMVASEFIDLPHGRVSELK